MRESATQGLSKRQELPASPHEEGAFNIHERGKGDRDMRALEGATGLGLRGKERPTSMDEEGAISIRESGKSNPPARIVRSQ